MLIVPVPATDKESNAAMVGIGRGDYVISIIGISLLGVASGYHFPVWGYIFGAVLAVFPTIHRLENLQWPYWLALAMLVPGLNVLLFLTLMILPEDYAETRKLDRDARVVLICSGILIAIVGLFYGSIYYRIWRNSRPSTPTEIRGR